MQPKLPVTTEPFDLEPTPTYLHEPMHPVRRALGDPTPPPEPRLHRRLGQLCTAHPEVRDAVMALNGKHKTPLTLVTADTATGSDYLPQANAIVLSPKYAAADLGYELPELALIANKLILYRLAAALYLVDTNVQDPDELAAFNARQKRLWRLANPDVTGGPMSGFVRFYQGTNRSNYYGGGSEPGIRSAGLSPDKAGGDLGCKRWEKHDIAREYKDQRWMTATTSYDIALSYAREHTEWAQGEKRNEPTKQDVADLGGLVLGFDVPVAVRDQPDIWRLDNSGNRANWQTSAPVAAKRIEVFEALAVPGPLTKQAPPPMSTGSVSIQPRSATGQDTRRRYPATPGVVTNTNTDQ